MTQDERVDSIYLHEVGMTYAVDGAWTKKPSLLCNAITIKHESKDGDQIGFSYTKDGNQYAVLHNGRYTVTAKIAG